MREASGGRLQRFGYSRYDDDERGEVYQDANQLYYEHYNFKVIFFKNTETSPLTTPVVGFNTCRIRPASCIYTLLCTSMERSLNERRDCIRFCDYHFNFVEMRRLYPIIKSDM